MELFELLKNNITIVIIIESPKWLEKLAEHLERFSLLTEDN